MVEPVRIEPVSNRRELKDVVMFPFRLYRDDPNWVPPLIGERMRHYDPGHNPFFQHAEMQLFRALRGGETVGTIAAIDDERHRQIWDENVGFFGLFEAVHDRDVAGALFEAASQWLAERGRETIRGPMNLNINDECGLLIEGYDGPPVLMMTYNPPYYRELLECHGFSKAKDIYAFKSIIADFGRDMEHLPKQISRVARIAQERYGVTMRHIDLRRLKEEVALIKPLHRGAWSKNWGAVPMTDAEFDYLADTLKPVVDPELTYLAFIDGKPIGCFLTVPDYCQVAQRLGGRLFPFGWAKYLWYKRKIAGIRVLIMGVLEEHRLKGVESLFYQEGCRIAVRKGYEWAELSWILEDNYKVIRGIEMMGGKRYRTYRFYERATQA